MSNTVKYGLNYIYIYIYIGIAILLFAGCPHSNTSNLSDSGDTSAILFKDIQYNLQTGNSVIAGKAITHPVMQYSLAANRRFLLTSEVRNKSQPLIVLYDLADNTERVLTDGQEIAYYPAVNDNGDYAYVCTSNSNAVSRLFLNGSEITPLLETLYYHLSLSDSFLFLAELKNEQLHICRYNIKTTVLERIAINDDLKIAQAAAFDNNKMLIQAYSVSKRTANVYAVDFSNSSIRCITENVGIKNEYLRHVVYTDRIIVDAFEGNSTPLVYAYLDIVKGGLGLPLAFSDNRFGRLSWYISYQLEGLLALCRAMNYPEELTWQVTRSVQAILDVRNKYNGIPKNEFTVSEGWATRKYSLDKTTAINLLVDDATVLYPLLLYAGTKICDENTKIDILNIATVLWNYYEKWYKNGHYWIQKGINLDLDGVIMPWNYEAVWSICLLELYALTGDIKYKKRAADLAQSFKSECIYTPNDRLIWFYWPQWFQQGWTADQNISIHTPEKAPYVYMLYEDSSHGGFNAKFIQRFYAAHPDEVFTAADMQALKKTAKSLLVSGKYYRFLNADEPAYPYPAGYEYETSMYGAYGWNDLCLPEMKQLYVNFFEPGRVFFDSSISFAYIFQDMRYDNFLRVYRTAYDRTLTVENVTNQVVKLDDYLFRDR